MALQLPSYSLSIGSASPAKHFTEYDNAGFYRMADSIAKAGDNLGNGLGAYMQRQREQEGLASMASAMNSGDYGSAAMAAANAGDREMAVKLAMAGMQQKQENAALSQVNSILGGGDAGGGSAGMAPASYPQDGASNTKPVPKIVVDTAEKYGINPNDFARMAWIESRFNPNAAANGSSAGGLFQFIDSTAANYGLRNKFDPAANADAAARLWMDNKAGLTKALGREPTGGELYLAHQQGLGGAAKLLANPNAPATSIVGGDAVRLNGGSSDMTAGQFANLWINKFNRVQPGIGKEQGPQANPTAYAENNAPYKVASNGFTPPPSNQPAQPQSAPNTDAIIAKMQNMGKVLMLPNVPDTVKAGIKAQMDVLNSQLAAANEQYRFSRDQDAKYNFENFQTQNQRRTQSLNAELEAQKAFDSSTGKGYGDQYNTLRTGAESAYNTLGTLGDLKAAMASPDFRSGTGADYITAAKRLGASVGLDPNVAAPNEVFSALANKLVLDANNGSLGAGVSNADVGFIKSIKPNTAMTPQALNRLVGIMEKNEQGKIDLFNQANEYANSHNGRLDMGWDKEMMNSRKSRLESRNQPETQTAPMEGRTATNPQTGQRIILRNGRWEPL